MKCFLLFFFRYFCGFNVDSVMLYWIVVGLVVVVIVIVGVFVFRYLRKGGLIMW